MNSTPLTDEERALLSARADAFHAALARGDGGDWNRYVADLPERFRRIMLSELAIIDLVERWKNGETPLVEDYVARFPELGPVEEVPRALIVEECRCRARAGEQPSLDSYRSRFPRQFADIQSEIESVRGATEVDTLDATMVSDDGGAAAARSHQPGSGAQDFEFLRVLGRGVFGEVWLARKVTSGIEKAIKILLHPSDRDAGSRERRALELIKNLRHPYLLATDDFWISSDRLHIVMELADCTLRNRLQVCREAGKPGIPPQELLGYMGEAAEGLDFLHSRHVTHRDIKPDNILLLHGHAKVGDFGLARYQEEVLAPMKTFAGTPVYMPPEGWEKKGGPASDQYSLAVTYVELRQGFAPIKPRSFPDMLAAHAEGEYEFSEAIPDAERAVIRKALAKEPGERYPSCVAFVEALTESLGLTLPRRPSGTVPVKGLVRREAAQEPTHPDSDVEVANETPRARPTVAESGTPIRSTPSIPPRSRWLVFVGAGMVLIGLTAFGIWAFSGKGGGRNGGSGTASRLERDPDKPDAAEILLNDDRKAWNWVRTRVGDQTVSLRLIFGGVESGSAVEPFYIMESKVWNSLYRAGGMTPPADSELNGPDAPVMGITAKEAADFAGAALGGSLPSPQQWDHAAGLYTVPRVRPMVTRAGGRPRIMIPHPQSTHGSDARHDVNDFGLLDMAGNGREWTSGIVAPPGQSSMVTRAIVDTDLVILRGRNFTLSRGLTFADLEYEQRIPQTNFATARSPYTSFRVVVPVP